MTFAEAFAVTDPIPGSFTELSCARLFDYAMQVPVGGRMGGSRRGSGAQCQPADPSRP